MVNFKSSECHGTEEDIVLATRVLPFSEVIRRRRI
jgi:hypothetical protein